MMSNCLESQTPQVVNAVITSFDELIDAVPQSNRRLNTIGVVPHLKAITMVTDEVFVKENILQVHDKDISEKCETFLIFVKCTVNLTWPRHTLPIHSPLDFKS